MCGIIFRHQYMSTWKLPIIFGHLVEFVGGTDWIGGRFGLRCVLWLEMPACHSFTSFCQLGLKLTCPGAPQPSYFQGQVTASRSIVQFTGSYSIIPGKLAGRWSVDFPLQFSQFSEMHRVGTFIQLSRWSATRHEAAWGLSADAVIFVTMCLFSSKPDNLNIWKGPAVEGGKTSSCKSEC